jgi:hypothetical protein
VRGYLNRYIIQICPEVWQNWWGCICCVDPLTQPPLKNGKYPEPHLGLTSEA